MNSNFTDHKADGIRVELKYCERCGGLWLREVGSGEVYCDHCEASIAELPAPKRKRPRTTPDKAVVTACGVEVDDLYAFAPLSMGGAA
jgi:uncharacterized Zn finger protein (UPF0148 family)